MVEVGQVISGKYKLLRLLGDGGMGSVYEAEHLSLGTHVAIKVLHADLARKAGIAERFLQEARVSAQIRSLHVVQVTDVDRTPDGIAYLVMELLHGEPLGELVKREKKLGVPMAIAYAIQILEGLESAHSLGVIHRDLKPDNVFVTFQGGRPVLKLIDFGIAKLKTAQVGQTKNLTVAGMLMGTPEYMAPEQAYSAAEVDVRADIYAVGVMLYEMLSGSAPATADDPRVLILKIERGEITPLVQAAPGIPPEIAGLVHRAMAPRPELRFANATEMRMALEDIASGRRPGTARLAQRPAGSDRPAPVASAGLGPMGGPSVLPSGGATGGMSLVPKGGTSLAPQMPVHVPPGGASPFADTADARPDPGTGTVMGAPVEAALAPAHAGQGQGPAPYPPPQHAQHPPPHHVPPMQQAYAPAPATRSGAKGGGSGLIIALAVVALLLGAGAVIAYVSSTTPAQAPVPPIPTLDTPPATTTPTTPPPNTPVTPVTPLTTSTVTPPAPPRPPTPPAKHDAGPAHPDAGPAPAPDAGSGQTVIVTPFGTFQFPGPRPPFYPADQPWPPATIAPLPGPAP